MPRSAPPDAGYVDVKQNQTRDILWSWMLNSPKPSSKCSTPTQPFFPSYCQNSMHTSVENLFRTIVPQRTVMNLIVFA